MYLHLGGDVSVRTADIVTVCDLDNASASHITRAFLRAAQEADRVVNVAEDLPKSFVVCAPQTGGFTVYLSQLNSATLLKRAESGTME